MTAMAKVPTDISYIKKISAEIEEFLRSNNVDDTSIFDIRLCVEETVKNAMIHGNKNKKDLTVTVSYSLQGDKFTIEIEDQGKGFDPAVLPDPTQDENLMRAGGRGVYLVHKMMDEVAYNTTGNKVSMVKSVKINKGGGNAR
jgi:serine/threonine-protein kinase RsbW